MISLARMSCSVEPAREDDLLKRIKRSRGFVWALAASAAICLTAVGRLSEIKAPTLVVVGDLDMPGIIDISNRIEKEVKGSKKVVIKGAAHTVNMEKPEKFNRVVAEFLGR